jgi:hypothetical protein
MTEDVKQVVDVINLIRDYGTLGEPSLSNVAIDFDILDVPVDEFSEFVEAVDKNTNVFSSLVFNINDTYTAFSLRGGQIIPGAIEEINDSGIEADIIDCEEGFVYYRDEVDDIGTAAEQIYEFAEELSELDGLEIESEVILDKNELAESVVYRDLSESLRSGYNPTLWLDSDRFDCWLASTNILETISSIYGGEGAPIFLFGSDVEQVVDSIVLSSINEFNQLTVNALEDCKGRYVDLHQDARKITQWRDTLIPVHPKQVFPLYDGDAVNEAGPLLVFAILGIFSKEVEKINSNIQYTYTLNPSYKPVVDLNELFVGFQSEELDNLIGLYREFEPNENDSAFRDLWQRAITTECGGESVTTIPSNAGDIRNRFEEFRATAVSENFDDLSEVLDDTQSLMADITSRLSDAANDVSRQIQGLTFTLLGAIVANVFLVLRWGSKDLVPPFSIFILIIIVGFYIPLVQGRIENLDDTLKEINNDFGFYQSQIRRFNPHLFGPELENRMEAHEKLAKNQRNRAQKQLKLVFYVSLTAWVGLALWTGVAYQPGLLRTGSLAISIVVLGLISGLLPGDHGEGLNHTEYDYFNRSLVLSVAFLVGISLIIQIVIFANPSLSDGALARLPRFQNETSLLVRW